MMSLKFNVKSIDLAIGANKLSATFILLFGFVSCACFAQADSLIVARTKWNSKKIAQNMRLKSFWYNNSLFSSNQNISMLEVRPGRKYALHVEAEPKELRTTSEFGVASEAVAALNGTFFDIKNGGSMDYIRVDREVVNSNRLQRDSIRALHQKAAIVLEKEKVDIVSWDSTSDWEHRLPGEDVMVTGPLLLYNGTIATLDSSDVYLTRHPRSVFAIKGKKILLITVDGRDERAVGMSLHELARFMKWIKADKAINLDGGGSTTLWVKQDRSGRVVNNPSDRVDSVGGSNASLTQVRAGEHSNSLKDDVKTGKRRERPVANVIVIKKKKT